MPSTFAPPRPMPRSSASLASNIGPAHKRKYDATSVTSDDEEYENHDDEPTYPRRGGRASTGAEAPPNKRSKNLVMLDMLKATMIKYPHCSSIADLVAAVRVTEHYDDICNAYLDHRAENCGALLWMMSFLLSKQIDLMGALASLPDDIVSCSDTGTVQHVVCRAVH
ncbi:hypothetical protein RRG08_065008 [Elysia crispata]|uniref:Uncharacterized protein n=1 Tax=Elysia crispata TaxID=231223 RepID=A0AAE1DYL2_9GAST|nr:hypothetical protein RRG08_065008 [Elysia crispata]